MYLGQDLPDRATRAAIHTAIEQDLQVALADPMDHPWHGATSTAVGEGDAGHGEATAMLDAEDFDGERVGHLARTEERPGHAAVCGGR